MAYEGKFDDRTFGSGGSVRSVAVAPGGSWLVSAGAGSDQRLPLPRWSSRLRTRMGVFGPIGIP
jgi:hypothetical protein